MKGKRGLSAVVATVLLILLSLAAVSIIAGFVIPFARDSLDEGGACFDLLGDLQIADTGYNCYAENPDNQGDYRSGFSVRVENENIIGFRVGLTRSGSSSAYILTDETEESEITKIGPGSFIPGVGEVRTYFYEGIIDKVEIAPLTVGENSCDISDSIKLKECVKEDVIYDLWQIGESG